MQLFHNLSNKHIFKENKYFYFTIVCWVVNLLKKTFAVIFLTKHFKSLRSLKKDNRYEL